MVACLSNNKASESWAWALRDCCAHVQVSGYVFVTCVHLPLYLFPVSCCTERVWGA